MANTKKTNANFRLDSNILQQARWLCKEMNIPLSLVVGQALRTFVYQKRISISYYPDEYISSVSPEEAEQLENLPAFS